MASSTLRHEVLIRPLTRFTSYNLFDARKQHLATNINESYLIKIDDSCLNRLKQVLNEPRQEFLRVNVETGGCSGFSYVFDIEKDEQIQVNEDLVFERDHYRIVVNKEILPLINGSTIEYHESLIKSSFQVVNPIAEAKCSCGSSFSIDLSKLQKSKSKDQEVN